MTDTVNPGTETTVNPGTEVVVDKPVETIVSEPVKQEAQPWVSNDWREKLAGGDAKELARLQRFTDINSVYKSYRELETKISSGALKQEVDVSKFDETQLTEWRKANGIPATAGDYQIDVPEGTVLSDEDQTILGSALDAMHKNNTKPAVVNEVVGAFLQAREVAHAAEIDRQNVMRTQAEEALRQEWHGATYLTNLAAVKNMLASAPDGIGDLIAQARLPDGSIVGNNPTALKWLAQTAMELNPAGTVVPGAGADQMQSIESELAGLNALMAKDLNAWRKNDAARERHRELLDAQLKMKARGY